MSSTRQGCRNVRDHIIRGSEQICRCSLNTSCKAMTMTIDESGSNARPAKSTTSVFAPWCFAISSLEPTPRSFISDSHCVRKWLCIVDCYDAAASNDFVRNLTISWCTPNDCECDPDSNTRHRCHVFKCASYLVQNRNCWPAIQGIATPLPALFKSLRKFMIRQLFDGVFEVE